MAAVVALAVLAIIALVLIVAVLFADEGGPKAAIGMLVVSSLVIGAVMLAFSATTVGARQIGVITTFGKVSDRTLEPGLSFISPFSKVEELDGSVITQKFTVEPGGASTDSNKKCVGVQIGDLSQACVAGVIRYQHDIDQADTLYSDYRGVDARDGNIDGINEAIADALIRTQLTSTVGQVFRTFNPLVVQTSESTQQASSAADLDELSDEVTAALKDRLPGIDLDSFTVTRLYYSDETNANIRRLQGEAAKTREATQAVETAKKQREANEALISVQSTEPNALVARCLEIVAQASDNKTPLPATFNCFGSVPATPTIPVG